ncbi:MAG: drug/metabolite transporter (DMT)-like permease [Flavobacteriaceae bacterium]|jgi:drug/metabolite transporter (DMT)-like permease
MSKVLYAHISIFLVNALYGANHVIAKGVMPDYIKPNVFILLRASGACILFWMIKLLLIREKVQGKDLLRLAACGMFGVTINQLLFFNGLNLTSSINSGIIMTTNPILVVILSFFLLKEKITWRKSVGIAVGATGAILLTLTAGTGSGDSFLGDIFIFINAMSYGLYLVLVKPLMKKYRPLTVITYVFSFGLLFVMLYPPTLMEFVETDFGQLPTEIILKILFVVIFVTFLTYLLTVYGLKFLSPSVSSAYIYLQPAMVVFFAFTLGALGISDDYTNTITLEKGGYMLIIFTGVYLTSSSSFRKRTQ